MKKGFKHSLPTILSCVGVIGVATTAILSATATPKAMRLLEEAKREKGEDLSTLEVVKTALPQYIPAMLSGFATITCILGANVLNVRQQASIISAYAALDRAHKEYANNVKETVGEDKEDEIRQAVIRSKNLDEYSRQLFYDMYLNQYFESTMDLVVFDDGLECYLVDTSSMFQDRENLN